jgi:hypothetical protein
MLQNYLAKQKASRQEKYTVLVLSHVRRSTWWNELGGIHRGHLAGGLAFGHWSEKIGRVNAITIASLIALPAVPLWAFVSTPVLLALGAFVMQVA